MNNQQVTEILSSAQSKLPAVDQQSMKFCHFRYKAISLEDENNSEFCNDTALPYFETYCASIDAVKDTVVFPYGGVTAAFKINPKTGDIHVGLSKCSVMDSYNKHTGRMISSGRFEHGRHTHVRFPSLISFNLADAIKVGVEIKDKPASAIVRDMLIEFLNSGTVKDISNDMSHIRSYVASRTSIPFVVEMS